jgi:hypothetical protein
MFDLKAACTLYKKTVKFFVINNTFDQSRFKTGRTLFNSHYTHSVITAGVERDISHLQKRFGGRSSMACIAEKNVSL